MIFRYPELAKYSTMVDAKNYAFHGSLDEVEMEELVLLCSKPANRAFLDGYGLELADVEYLVEKLQVFREELTKDFRFTDGRRKAETLCNSV